MLLTLSRAPLLRHLLRTHSPRSQLTKNRKDKPAKHLAKTGACRVARTLETTIPNAHDLSTNKKSLCECRDFQKRRARDSNPQLLSEHLISSQAANHSLTLRAAPIKSEKVPTDKAKRT